ncbi:SRPBCC family protein [uncultured Litoreibacter sp.]|uniref:SRPBCC family protein n=1 Tax=uncultured Litoreibacter sp. TaxID=1392394 RepID=UPI00260504A2|nr:SRPBCC family protein [uncultured Litoreibacter sp.]
MTTISKTITINAPISKVWEKVSDTGRISDLIGFLASSIQEGDSRVCMLEGGGELTEKIVSVDHELKRVVYAITSSPLNMDFHVATMQLEEDHDNTRLNWIVDLLPADARDHMEPMLDSACADMTKALAA